MKLDGKKAIIVGASGGIGSAITRALHAEGAIVVLAARTKEKLDALAAELGERTLVVPTDASNPGEVKDLFEAAQKALGRIDAVIISAGSWARLSPTDNLRQAEDLISFHYRGIFLPTFFVSFAAQQLFSKQRGGLIANISSHAAIQPELPNNLSYGPMKAATRHLMLSLRQELKGTGVRVTDIEPAIVNTPDNLKWLDTPKKQADAVQPEAIAEWLIDHFDDPEIPTEILFDSKVVV